MSSVNHQNISTDGNDVTEFRLTSFLDSVDLKHLSDAILSIAGGHAYHRSVYIAPLMSSAVIIRQFYAEIEDRALVEMRK